MTTIEISITVGEHTYSATVEGERISISQDGHWAGNGRYVDGQIVDCAATLGGSDDASEEAYAAIADALDEAAGETTGAVEVQLESPVGPRVLYVDGVEAEEIDAALPAGWAASYSDQVRTDAGRWSVPLVREARGQRYTIHPVADERCDSCDESEMLGGAATAAEAERLASELSAGQAYGVAVRDSETGLVDYGAGFGRPAPSAEADEIQVGSWVVGGTGEDADYGTVASIDGDTAIVSWRGSETRTSASVAGLTVCESREAAREACGFAAQE
jgi:hypothetical protein